MSPIAEIDMPTSKKETVKLILKLQEESRQLERRVHNLELTNKSFKQYANVGTASTIGMLPGVQLD